MSRPRLPAILFLCGLAAGVLLALLPWWRNHHYLRDLYDYGLVLASNGHLDAGERPYVDFTTPIQAGFLGLSWAIERAGGGTYAALTRGAAGLILLGALALPLMLVRRWPGWAALATGITVTVASASQHTILWHNTLGVVSLALVAWAAAVAPVLRRADWPWHLLALAGLFLGGINKLNFHLVAVAAALAWALRAGLTGRAGWGRVGVTAAALAVAGLVAPMAVELAWTGATPKLWFANVAGIATGSRFEQLALIFTKDFLFHPIHDYYGTQVLPQAGLAGLLLSGLTLAGCWPRGGREGGAGPDRVLAPLAVVLATAAGAALLATNFEIACIGVAAWIVLMTSLWLGFAPERRGWLLAAGFVPAVLAIGVTGWWSAWTGQRSQFGYSLAPRSAYRPADSADPAYASLRGLRLPPENVLSLEALAQVLAENPDGGPRPVFYGPGMEYMDRFFPSHREKGQPLWGHWGTSYSEEAIHRLRDGFLYSQFQRTAFTTVAFAHWPAEVEEVLREYFVRDTVGPIVARWRHRDDAQVSLNDSLGFLSRLGGNVDSRMLHLDRNPLRLLRLGGDRYVLGTSLPAGQVLLRTPLYRMEGAAVVSRLPTSGDGPLAADFKIIVHGASPEEVRWSARVELPAGQASATLPFQVDGHGKLLMLWTTRPPGQDSPVLAGFRDLTITHAAEAAEAPRLSDSSPADVPASPAQADSFFGPLPWRPAHFVVRNGGPAEDGLELSPAGECWLHSDDMTGEVRMRVHVAGDRPALVRAFWYKGGRIQVIQQEWVRPGQPAELRVWTAEPGGWIGLTSDAGGDLGPVRVRAVASTLQP